MNGLPPYITDPLNWYTLSEFSKRINRPFKTVECWVYRGTLTGIGFQLYQAPNKRWWIRVTNW